MMLLSPEALGGARGKAIVRSRGKLTQAPQEAC